MAVSSNGPKTRAIASNKYPLLWQEEEVALAKIIQGDESASSRLSCREALSVFFWCNLALISEVVKGNKGLVYQVATFDLNDLRQLGHIGLLVAIERYDWRRGVKFSGSAITIIQASIRHGVQGRRYTIQLPRDLDDQVFKLRRRLEGYEQAGVPVPDDGELAEKLGVSLNKLRQLYELQQHYTRSLSQTVCIGEWGDEVTLKDVLADRWKHGWVEQIGLEQDRGNEILHALKEVDERLPAILAKLFLPEAKDSSRRRRIAEELEISLPALHGLIGRGKAVLKAYLEDHTREEWLEEVGAMLTVVDQMLDGPITESPQISRRASADAVGVVMPKRDDWGSLLKLSPAEVVEKLARLVPDLGCP
ncbi:MAG TPA: hypothetical protein VLI05_03870 [Candidatus Saccharimonadia bacterium]|nr:hypothetical protein [Candidatus Saccharimonadia bacterium]